MFNIPPYMKYKKLIVDGQGKKSAYHTGLLQQAAVEFKAAYEYIENRRQQYEVNMRLYNNQMKGKDTVGDPLIYTTIQTIVAALYDDKLGVKNLPAREEDVDKAEQIDNICSNDYYVMRRGEMDYSWIHNAAFYGFSPVLLQKWDKKKNCPVPELMDPMTFYFDPSGVLVNPAFGKAGLRYFGRQMYKSLRDLKKNGLKKDDKDMTGKYFNTDWTYSAATGMGQIVNEVRQARASVQNLNYTRTQTSVGASEETLVTEWWTFWTDNDTGVTKRMYLEIKGNISEGADSCCVIRCEELPFQDHWPLINRVLSPVPDQFIGVSIPDLMADKQRYRAKLLNLTLLSTQYATYGMHLVDRNRIDMEQVGTPRPNKLIGVDGDVNGAFQQVQMQGARQDVQWVMSYLDQAAQQASATPAIQQGMTPDKSRSATELATQRMNIDKRYSLSAKILGWSEREFWEQWYRCYHYYFVDAKPKIIRVEGPIQSLFDSLVREDFIMKDAPEFRIESAVLSEIQRTTSLQNLSNMAQLIMQNPNANMDYFNNEMARLSGLSLEQRLQLIPKTPDQLLAEKNNDLILEGKKPVIKITDNHMLCITVAAKLPEGKIRDWYIERHTDAMLMIKENPEIMPAPSAVNIGNPNQPNPELAAVGAGQASQPNLQYKNPNFFQ